MRMLTCLSYQRHDTMFNRFVLKLLINPEYQVQLINFTPKCWIVWNWMLARLFHRKFNQSGLFFRHNKPVAHFLYSTWALQKTHSNIQHHPWSFSYSNISELLLSRNWSQKLIKTSVKSRSKSEPSSRESRVISSVSAWQPSRVAAEQTAGTLF